MRNSIIEVLSPSEAEELLEGIKPSKIEVELKGKLTKDIIEEISKIKKEPDWLRRLRLRYLEIFEKMPAPNWLVGIKSIDLEGIAYYVKPDVKKAETWEELPEEVRRAYEAVNIPEIEKRFLAGLTAQLESEVVYVGFKKWLEEKGVIITDMDTAVKKYPDLVKKYLFNVYPPDHKFAALHAALWSGGAFAYIPPGVKVPQPLEAFFLVSRPGEGNFEHTVVIVDEGAEASFLEGCAAPRMSKFAFHDGMVEVYVGRGAKLNFYTFQNWSGDVININNKRGLVERNGRLEWIEVSIGARASYVYPTAILRGEGASTEIYNVTLAREGRIKDGGSKVIFAAPNTKGKVISKSISFGNGINVFRGLIEILKGAENATAFMQCDSLLIGKKAKSITYPHIHIFDETAVASHEAHVGKLSEDVMHYLRSRGLKESEALSAAVTGFVADVMIKLPFEPAAVLAAILELEFSQIGGVA
jgi:Fe-S cluster assembly protein SufB